MIAFLLIVAMVGAASAAESGLDAGEPELVEAGYVLATKAASLYAEEYFPGSSLGPGEPVYDITDENSIVGWYYIVDTNGENCVSFSEYLSYLDEMYIKYLSPLLLDEPFEDLNALTKFNNLLKRYKALYISNYLNYGPLLDIDKGRTITITTIPYQIKQISEMFNTELMDYYALCSLPNSSKFSIRYTDSESVTFYSIRLFEPVYFSSTDFNKVVKELRNNYIGKYQTEPLTIWGSIINSNILEIDGTLRDDLEWHDWYYGLPIDLPFHEVIRGGLDRLMTEIPDIPRSVG